MDILRRTQSTRFMLKPHKRQVTLFVKNTAFVIIGINEINRHTSIAMGA